MRAFTLPWIGFVAVLALLLGIPRSASAQAVHPTSVSAAASAVTADKRPEEEAADSPRACMRAFLDLCDRGRYDDAAHYLDVPKGGEKRGGALAQKLYEVLQKRNIKPFRF